MEGDRVEITLRRWWFGCKGGRARPLLRENHGLLADIQSAVLLRVYPEYLIDSPLSSPHLPSTLPLRNHGQGRRSRSCWYYRSPPPADLKIDTDLQAVSVSLWLFSSRLTLSLLRLDSPAASSVEYLLNLVR